MARPSKFAHVVYSTRRFDEMIDWYQRVFDASVVYQNPAFAFLTYDDEHHRFAFAMPTLVTCSALTSGSNRWTSIHTGAFITALRYLFITISRRQSNGVSSGLRHGRRGECLHA